MWSQTSLMWNDETSLFLLFKPLLVGMILLADRHTLTNTPVLLHILLFPRIPYILYGKMENLIQSSWIVYLGPVHIVNLWKTKVTELPSNSLIFKFLEIKTRTYLMMKLKNRKLEGVRETVNPNSCVTIESPFLNLMMAFYLLLRHFVESTVYCKVTVLGQLFLFYF